MMRELIIIVASKASRGSGGKSIMPGATKRRYQLPRELELERIVTLREAHEISGLSPDAWKDNYPDKIIRLSPRRLGIRLRDVLAVGQPAA
jgi:hypothetical protein